MKHKIEEGDLVKIKCLQGRVFIGTVLYIPCATGDCWRILTEGSDGMVVYVQTFEYMILNGKGLA